MKTIGIIGGLGPEASLHYYRLLIDLSRERQSPATTSVLPDLKMILYDVDMREVTDLFIAEEWPAVVPKLVKAVQCLFRAGADLAIIACNTAHIVFDDVKTASPIPLLSIVEETGRRAVDLGLTRVGLFGGRTTMRNRFYQDVFSKLGITVIVPNDTERDYIYAKLREELLSGIIRDETHTGFLKITRRLIDEEAIEGLVLGCTEIPLLLTKDELGIPFLNTSKIHVQSAFQYALEK